MARSKLIYASSEASADQLYATGFRAPDAFPFLETGGRKVLLLSDLEVDRGRSETKGIEIESWSELEAALGKGRRKKPSAARVLAAWLRRHKAGAVLVPGDFPFALARALKKEGVRLKPTKGMFWPARQQKTAAEVRKIEAALRVAEAAMTRAFDVLAATRIRADGILLRGRSVLTAEALRTEIETAIVAAGGESRGDSIVACGEQACDPHARGAGPLRAQELIILDIFPRHAKSGYFGDITRTVVRGRASDAQRRLWETCLAGQRMALEAMSPGVEGGPIHEKIKSFFAAEGYATERRDGRWQGFFHGTGHGLGLEIHEEPRFSATTFVPGQVITVEPGIYMPGLGGVRHEDVALVTRRGAKLLTRLEKPFEI